LYEDDAGFKRNLAGIYNARGNASYSKSEFASALEDYKKTIEFDSKTVVYHDNLILALIGLKDWVQAIQAAAEANKLYPENPKSTENLANVYNARGNDYFAQADYSSAINDYDKAIELDSKLVFHENRVLALTALKEWEHALAAAEQAKELYPDDAAFNKNLANIYNARGNEHYGKDEFEAALEDCEKVIELDPQTSVYRNNLVLALVAVKEWERAFAAAEKGKEVAGDEVIYKQNLAIIYNTRGNDYLNKREYAPAIKDYEKAIELSPETAVYHDNLLLGLTGLKEWEQAFAAAEKAKHLSQDGYAQNLARIYNARGNDDFSRGEYGTALKDYEKAIDLDSKTVVYRTNVVLALMELKEWDRAFAAAEAEKELHPDNLTYIQVLAMIYNARGKDYYKKGQYVDALKDCEKASELDPKAAVYHVNLVLGLTAQKEWERAFAEAEKVKELSANNAVYAQSLAGIYNARGNDYLSKDEPAAARKNYEKAVELDPSMAIYHDNLSLASIALKQP
jgi:tetratricopeptide (TPR) repeat protein